MSIHRFPLRNKVTLRLFESISFLNSLYDRVVLGAGHKAKRLMLQWINGFSWNSVEKRHLKYLTLRLLGLIFRRIETNKEFISLNGYTII